MSDQTFEQWEAQVRATARTLPYPATPDLAGAVRERLARPAVRFAPRRRFGYAVIAVAVALFALLALPPVRAAVLDVLRIGAVRIRLIEPTPTPAPPMPIRTTPTPAPPTATPLRSVLDLAGETTLADARRRAAFPIKLPTYPADLGPPNQVFFQNPGSALVVLVWRDPNRPDRVRLSLEVFESGVYAEKSAILEKSQMNVIATTSVNGQTAIWTEGAHLLLVRTPSGEELQPRRIVQGNVLIWTEGDLTYRLENNLSMQEAVRIAESLR